MITKTNTNNGSTWVPYLYLKETATLADLAALAQEANIELVPKTRYYYRYKDALRIIDFVRAKGVYDGWVVLVQADDRPQATEMLRHHPNVLLPFAEVEQQFLSSLSTEHLRQALGSQYMKGLSLEIATQLLSERKQPVTPEEIALIKEEVRTRNIEEQPRVRFVKWIIWTGIVLLGLVYLFCLLRC